MLETIKHRNKEEELVWVFEADPAYSRSEYLITDERQLYAKGLDILNINCLPERKKGPAGEDQRRIQHLIANGGIRALNVADPRWQNSFVLEDMYAAPVIDHMARVNILALGDVGSTLLTGLHLMGGDVISSIGIYDVNETVGKRWEFEMNQITYPWDYFSMPPVETITRDQLFDCDVFVFVASRGIPAVGSGVKDVRMAQLEMNREIIEEYAVMAREKDFQGLFAVVSDPVDPLAKYAYLASNRNEKGEYDWFGLRAEQVQGYGLGVMNARAAYYAKKESRFRRFLEEGRAFGPHGQDLVIANSIENYDDAISRELTEKVVTANLELRALGYKPYVAPAMSSGALSILLTLRGEWHYGSVFLDGVFMGVKNRYTAKGLETELLAIPEPLFERIVHAAEGLKAIKA